MPITQLLAQESKHGSLYWLLVREFRGIASPTRTGVFLENLVEQTIFLAHGRERYQEKWL